MGWEIVACSIALHVLTARVFLEIFEIYYFKTLLFFSARKIMCDESCQSLTLLICRTTRRIGHFEGQNRCSGRMPWRAFAKSFFKLICTRMRMYAANNLLQIIWNVFFYFIIMYCVFCKSSCYVFCTAFL